MSSWLLMKFRAVSTNNTSTAISGKFLHETLSVKFSCYTGIFFNRNDYCYHRNDIIIAKQPDKPEALICKRIAALVSDACNLSTISHHYTYTSAGGR